MIKKQSNFTLQKLLVTFIITTIVAMFAACNFTIDDKNSTQNEFVAAETSNGHAINSAANDSSNTSEKSNPDTSNNDSSQQETIAQAKKLIDGYFYDEAIALLETVKNNKEAIELQQKSEKLKNSLVKYEGRHYHVFFHSLIIDTAKAFDGDYMQQGYNMYMTTVSEFQKMLPLLLQENFILYDITDMVEFRNGKAYPKDIYLPEGKKPLVLSIDDVNYYEYMKNDGFANRLDVDSDGNVVTIVKNKDGSESVTYDGDVMPILDAFVHEHPEFSWKGAKGIVAVTGYQGAFGYRITDYKKHSKDDINQMREKVKEVASALRNTGWQIANHSYTHNRYWTEKTMTMGQLQYDIRRWLEEIAPYVGSTNIIITPFGVTYDQKDPRFRYIIDSGFNIYCPVGADMSMSWQKDNMMSSRLNLDGITMLAYPKRISRHFFEPSLVLDPSRPPLNMEKNTKKSKRSVETPINTPALPYDYENTTPISKKESVEHIDNELKPINSSQATDYTTQIESNQIHLDNKKQQNNNTNYENNDFYQ
ncbi:MAG: hypothetical protein IK065_00730 [Neisseriaceae bacterium]|nr:hypothetical protein [Neisseriaceae bacterium]